MSSYGQKDQLISPGSTPHIHTHTHITALINHDTYRPSDDPVFPGHEPGHSDRQVTHLEGLHHRLHTDNQTESSSKHTCLKA